MRTPKEWLTFWFERYQTDKSIGNLQLVRDFINERHFQRKLEGGFHFEEEARYLTAETIAKLQALKDFIKSPEFQKMVREGGLKDHKVVKDLRENTILREYIDLPQFQAWIKPGLKEDPEVQSIISQVDNEFAEIERVGFMEWKERVEEEKKRKEEPTRPKEPEKANPKKWLPLLFNRYLKHLSTESLIVVKEYLDEPGVQVELEGELKDDEELHSIASQVNKLWEDYQKAKEERERKLKEYWDEQVRQEEERRQMEKQEEEEMRRRDYESKIPIFD